MSSLQRGALGGLVTLIGVIIIAFFANTFAFATTHGQLVPESPRRDVPVVLDGSVFAHAQVGDRIFVGGDFQQVERPDGTVINQPYIFAYDLDTGLLDENFRPVLNNGVFDLQPTAAGDGLYVGGRFWKWDSAFPNRIAKLNADGTLDTSFQGSANAIVRSIAVTHNNVYLAGDFVTVSGQPRVGFAAVDPNTGAADPGFVMNVGNSQNGVQYGRGIVATSNGNAVFGLHFGTQINGQTRESLMKVNVSQATARLVNWVVPWTAQGVSRSCFQHLRDIAISPDDSFIVIGGQGADYPPNCDSVLRYETGGTGTINYTWSARMYSSVFSLAVSDVAVYVGGHFCAAPLHGAPVGGITHPYSGQEGRANGCDVNNPSSNENPSVKFPNEAVFRSQMAALNPANGQGLNWDPGSNNSLGVFDLTLIDRGLLAGHDSNRFGNDILTGRSGLFDFGVPNDTTAPTLTVTSPGAGEVLASVSTLTGVAEDDRDVSGVTLQLKNTTTGQWLQPNGSTLAATQANVPVTLTPTGLGTASWTVNVNTTLPAGEYEIRAFATDPSGNTTNPTTVSSFVIPGAAACTVTLDNDGYPVIAWSDFDGVASVQIRRDNSWKATDTPGNGTWTDTSVTPGSTYSYTVRYRPAGVINDVTCSPSSVTIPTGVGDDTAPSSTISNPGTEPAGSVTILGTAADTQSNIASVRVRIKNQTDGTFWNGASWITNANTWLLATGTNNWTYTLNLDPADYRINAYAIDTAGNFQTWADNRPFKAITVENTAADTTAPSSTIDNPGAEPAGSVTILGTATDTQSNIASVRVRIKNQTDGTYWNGTSWVTSSNTWLLTTGTNNWTYTLNLDPAEYRINAYATDTAGNVQTWADSRPFKAITVA